MLPPNSMSQIIQQITNSKNPFRFSIELEETFGSKGGIKEIPYTHLISIEYVDGILCTYYYSNLNIPAGSGNPVAIEIIPWQRIKGLYFDQEGIPSRVPFPASISHL